MATVTISSSRQNPRTVKVTIISRSLWSSPATLLGKKNHSAPKLFHYIPFVYKQIHVIMKNQTNGDLHSIHKTYLTTTPIAKTINIRSSIPIHHKIRFLVSAILQFFVYLLFLLYYAKFTSASIFTTIMSRDKQKTW